VNAALAVFNTHNLPYISSREFKLEDGSERTARGNTFQKFQRKTFVGCFEGRYVAATNASVFRPLAPLE
jgi:hypothetical protein